jgi:hypothetical protein
MKLGKYISTASVVCSLTLGLSGSAFADSITISETGADSDQVVVIDNTSDVTVSNTSNVHVSNVNFQNAQSGDVSANKNTSVGGLESGSASNNNSAVTSVAVSNEAATAVPVGGNGNGNGNEVNAVGGSGAVTPAGGSVLGAAAVGGFGAGVATLPEVGASVPMDVSALRAAWHPQTSAPAAALAKSSQMFTGLMLLTATLLSLLGAIGSAWYAKRQERV